MKFVAVLGLFVIGAAVGAPADTYKGQFDNIDVDEVLHNERLYKSYFGCFKGAGKCTPDGKEIKDIIPEALSTNCQKCSPEHKAKTDHVLKFLIENKHADYEELEKIYDPGCEYRKQHKAEYAAKGIDLGECPK